MRDESQVNGNERIFWRLIEIGIALSSEHNTTQLMESILKEAQDITRAEGGTLYLLREGKNTSTRLEFNIIRNDKLHLHQVRSLDSTEPEIFPALLLHDQQGQPDHHNVATHVAWTRQLSNIKDVYEVTDFDFSGARRFDEKNGYRTQSLLTLPMCNHDQEIIGVLQLINARDESGHVMAFPESQESIVRALASLAAWIANPGIDVIISTGGTGFSGRDSTPEALAPLFDKTIDGFGELFRHISLQEIGTSTLQSRALAGMANQTLIFCVPGSTGACRTAWQGILSEQLDARTRPCNFIGVLEIRKQYASAPSNAW